MGMPKKFELGDRSSGVDVEFVKSRQMLYFRGWFDSFVGIEGGHMTLREFFDKLGIDEKTVKKAFAEKGKGNE